MTTYKINDTALEKIQALAEKLSKRAIKLGLAPIAINAIGETWKTNDEGYSWRLTEIEIIGESPVIAGWKFLASLDHTLGNSPVIRSLVEVKSSWRSASPRCVHCNANRVRNHTYVLVNEAGEEKQVGSSCLKDFLGHADPSKVAALFEECGELLDYAQKSDGDFDEERSGKSSRFFDVAKFLAYVALRIRTDGFFISRKMIEEGKASGSTTGQSALTAMFDKSQDKDRPSEKDYELTSLVLDWAANLEPENTYQSNLKAIANSEAIDNSHTGLAASIFPAYNYAHPVVPADKKVSEYFGTVGEKFNLILTVAKTVCLGDSPYNRYDVRWLVTFKDENGNDFSWFTTGDWSTEDEGKKFAVKGTIKEHKEYKGIKQTIITRCKIEEK